MGDLIIGVKCETRKESFENSQREFEDFASKVIAAWSAAWDAAGQETIQTFADAFKVLDQGAADAFKTAKQTAADNLATTPWSSVMA